MFEKPDIATASEVPEDACHEPEAVEPIPQVGEKVSGIPYFNGGKGEIIAVTEDARVVIRSENLDETGEYLLLVGPLNNLAPNVSEEPAEATVEEIRTSKEKIMADTHGLPEAFDNNLKALEVMDDEGNWCGEDAVVHALGDNVADRGLHDLEMFRRILAMQEGAAKAGGEFIWYAGNHEAILTAFLTGYDAAGDIPIEAIFAGGQAAGIGSLLEHFLDIKGITDYSDFEKLGLDGRTVGRQLLLAMREDPEGRSFLRSLCNMQLVNVTEENLFVHTDLTEEMAYNLALYGPEVINATYQLGLRHLLLGEGDLPEGFFLVEDLFLDTSNRDYCSAERAAELKNKLNVRNVIHGHTNREGKIQTIGGVNMIPMDLHAGRAGRENWRAVGEISADGTVRWGLNVDPEERAAAQQQAA